MSGLSRMDVLELLRTHLRVKLVSEPDGPSTGLRVQLLLTNEVFHDEVIAESSAVICVEPERYDW